MRVLVNGLSAHTGGGKTYLSEQLGALATQRHALSVTVYGYEELRETLAADANVDFHVVRRLPLVLRMLAIEQLYLAARSRRFEVLYSPGNFALFLTRTPQLVAFQNANHFGSAAREIRWRHYAPLNRGRKALEAMVARGSARHATRAIAISESLRRTMLEDIDVDISVLLSAGPSIDQSEPQPTSSGPDEGVRYVLAVSHDYPHKDWDGLIDTFVSDPDLPQLRLVGRCRSFRRLAELQRRIAGHGRSGAVILMGGDLSSSRIKALYRDARCFIAHSRLEAFPLTPFEAMSQRTAVLASDIPPHREVCGDSAQYYPVDDKASLVELLKCAPSSAEPPPLLRRGWDQNARELARLMRAAAGE